MPAFGSSKIGVFSKTAIEDPNFETNFDPTTASANYIPTVGGGSGTPAPAPAPAPPPAPGVVRQVTETGKNIAQALPAPVRPLARQVLDDAAGIAEGVLPPPLR